MALYTIKIDGLEDTFKEVLEDEYDIGERVLLAEERGEVIYDENGEEVCSTFPRSVYGTVVEKEEFS